MPEIDGKKNTGTRTDEVDRDPTFFDDVRQFHLMFALPVGERPGFTSPSDVRLRLRLVREEHIELIEAHDAGDIVEVADAIADMIYVLCGMAVTYGIPLNEVWHAVNRANFDKLGEDGKPIYRADGKVAKPAGWRPADIKGILHDHGL